MKSVRNSYFSYSLLYYAYFFAMGLFNSILSIYLAGVNKTSVEISLIVSASGIFTMVLQPIFGMLYDKLQKNRLVSIVLLSCSAVFGVLFITTQSTIFLLFLNGFAMSFLNGVNPVCERMATGTRYKYGTIRLWGAVGYACATQTAAFLLTEAPTEKATGAANKDKDTKDGASDGILARLLRNPQFLLFVLISFLFSGSTNANNTYVSLLLKDLLGNTTSVGTMLFFATLMELPIILFSDRYMDRFSGQTPVRINIFLLIAQYACYSVSPWAGPVCVVLFFCKSTATMLFIMVTLKVVLSIVDADCSTTALSLVTTAKGVGGAVITFAAGLISDAFGLRAVYMLMLGIVLVCLVLTVALRLPKESQKLF